MNSIASKDINTIFCTHADLTAASTTITLVDMHAGLLWRGFETYSQISFRNQSLVAVDWFRTKLFGRDISRV